MKMLIHAHFFRRAILTLKVGHTDLVFGVRSEFISRSVTCAHDYKSLCAALSMCSVLVNIQTHIHTHTDNMQLI